MFSWHSVWILCIFYISSLCQMHNWWRLFFHSERCLITCLMCFSFTRSHLSVVDLYVYTNGFCSESSFLCLQVHAYFRLFPYQVQVSTSYVEILVPLGLEKGLLQGESVGLASASWEKEFFHGDRVRMTFSSSTLEERKGGVL